MKTWRRMAFYFLPLFFFLFLLDSTQAQRRTGTISGQVLDEVGQPLARVIVLLSRGGNTQPRDAQANSSGLVTDAEGKFKAEGLDFAPYLITARVPGYVPVEAANPLQPAYVYVGETVTLRLRKGGVITGRVTDVQGEPVVGIGVTALPYDENQIGWAGLKPMRHNLTDDRGVYRLYGLPAGQYLVQAATENPWSRTPFRSNAPTFYPASTRAAAAPVRIQDSEELTGIDVRYRSETGLVLRGEVREPAGQRPADAEAFVTAFLKLVNRQEVLAFTLLQQKENGLRFAFYGVPAGEYEVFAAQLGLGNVVFAQSAPRRVSLNATDLSGIVLTLTPLATVKGQVVLEKLPPAEAAAAKCENLREFFLDETIINLELDSFGPKEAVGEKEAGGSKDAAPALDVLRLIGSTSATAPTAAGAFFINSLNAGRYRVRATLPDPRWYLKALAVTPARTPAVDVAGQGLTLRASEQFNSLQVVIAAGAASLQGRVQTAAGQAPPAPLRVHLVPAEESAKDEVMRYDETLTDSAGNFRFEQRAPGRYWLVAQRVPAGEKPARSPLAWDTGERAKLLEAAAAAKQAVELSACQRRTGFVLPWQ